MNLHKGVKSETQPLKRANERSGKQPKQPFYFEFEGGVVSRTATWGQ